jgi:hypothetical protein
MLLPWLFQTGGTKPSWLGSTLAVVSDVFSEADDGPFYVCEGCGQRIDADAPDTVKAVRVKRVDTMGKTEFIDGMGVLFHAACYRGGPRYRRTDRA